MYERQKARTNWLLRVKIKQAPTSARKLYIKFVAMYMKKLQARASFLSLKHLLVLINTKLHLKS